LVLTSRHVVAGAAQVTATIAATGAQFQAQVLGYDVAEDIAVLALPGAAGLQAATVGKSAKIARGTMVVAVGNAGGVGGAPTAIEGIILGRNRSITVSDGSGGHHRLNHLLATSVPLQPGQSGGALVVASGAVVGVNAAASFTGEWQSTAGWAVPIHRAMAVVSSVTRGVEAHGVHIGPPGFLGIRIDPAQIASGALVAGVVTGSAAGAAGLAVGDIITVADGKRIHSAQQLSQIIGAHHPGDSLRLKWRTQSGASRSANPVLGSGPVA
jgi:S1-C subfamily serine protease